MPMAINDEIVRLSLEFSDLADNYILGEKSLPHLTLYQFEVEEEEIVSIWEQLCEKWKEVPIDLMFEKFSCLTFDNHVFWVSLLPNHMEALHDMHEKIASIINKPIKKTFNPHMTLVNTKDKEYEVKIDIYSGSYKQLRDMFILKLGRCDDIGQFTEIIYTYSDMAESNDRI